MYDVQFNKNVILNNDFKHERNTTEGRIVFNGLEENMDYTFKVCFIISGGQVWHFYSNMVVLLNVLLACSKGTEKRKKC